MCVCSGLFIVSVLLSSSDLCSYRPDYRLLLTVWSLTCPLASQLYLFSVKFCTQTCCAHTITNHRCDKSSLQGIFVHEQTEEAKKGHINVVEQSEARSWWIIAWQRAPSTCRVGELLLIQFKLCQCLLALKGKGFVFDFSRFYSQT